MAVAEILTEAAPAKVNLTLGIVGRRADGFHLLDSLVVFAGVHDRLMAEPSDTLSLAVTGPFANGLSAGSDNLVLRAARALADRAGIRASAALRLEKNLPVASGIGGGSSDAAAALRVLCRLWDVAPADLHRLAAGLGADVPVCLAAAPCRMSGIGEVLSPAPTIPPCGLVLVNPGHALSTAAVFGALGGCFSAPAELPDGWPDAGGMAVDLRRHPNTLEAPALSLCPAIGEVLLALSAVEGCLLARMSGSGATCFALLPSPDAAISAAERLARPGWWCWGGGLHAAAPLYAPPAAS